MRIANGRTTMKRIILLTIGICCMCAIPVHAQNDWLHTGVPVPPAQMLSTSPRYNSNHTAQAYQLSGYVPRMKMGSTSPMINMIGGKTLPDLFANISEQSESNNYSHHSGTRRVGHDKPNEPGAPVGNGVMVLLLLAGIYCWAKATRSKIRSKIIQN